jgi:hypothetical protein
MKMFRAECECGFQGSVSATRSLARSALKGHVCPPRIVTVPKRCGSCGRTFPILVDGTLCIRCDAILYPEAS